MEVGTGRALSAVILVTWTATPGETARARRGSKNSSVRGCEWAPQLLHSCVPSPGPAPFFFYLRSSFNILAEPSRARTEKERERENGRRQIFTRPASKSSLPSFAPSSSKFFVGLVRRSRRNKHQILMKGTANRFKRDRQSQYRSNVYEGGNENVGRRFNRSGNICWTARTPAGQFRPGSSGSSSRSFFSSSRFRNAKITWMLE